MTFDESLDVGSRPFRPPCMGFVSGTLVFGYYRSCAAHGKCRSRGRGTRSKQRKDLIFKMQ